MTNKEYSASKKSALSALKDITKSPLRMIGILNRSKVKEVSDFFALNGITTLVLDDLTKDACGKFCARSKKLNEAETEFFMQFFPIGSSRVYNDTVNGTFYLKGKSIYKLVHADKFSFDTIVKSVALRHDVDQLTTKLVEAPKEKKSLNDIEEKVVAKLVAAGVVPEEAIAKIKALKIA